MSHKPNLLSWDQEGNASPREFHETDNDRTNVAAILATWQYFSFRNIRFSKLLSYQKLSQIILSYFLNALSFEQGKISFQISGKLSSFAKITNTNIARHFENHWSMMWRHTDNVYPRDAPSHLVTKHVLACCYVHKLIETTGVYNDYSVRKAFDRQYRKEPHFGPRGRQFKRPKPWRGSVRDGDVNVWS